MASCGPWFLCKMLILGYFLHFLHFWSIFVNFEPKKNLKIKKNQNKNQKVPKLRPKMLILAYFGPKINCMVKMTTPYPSPYCALSSCKMLGKNNEPFFR